MLTIIIMRKIKATPPLNLGNMFYLILFKFFFFFYPHVFSTDLTGNCEKMLRFQGVPLWKSCIHLLNTCLGYLPIFKLHTYSSGPWYNHFRKCYSLHFHSGAFENTFPMTVTTCPSLSNCVLHNKQSHKAYSLQIKCVSENWWLWVDIKFQLTQWGKKIWLNHLDIFYKKKQAMHF